MLHRSSDLTSKTDEEACARNMPVVLFRPSQSTQQQRTGKGI